MDKEAALAGFTPGDWREAGTELPRLPDADAPLRPVDGIRFLIEDAARLFVDDILLYGPREVTSDEM